MENNSQRSWQVVDSQTGELARHTLYPDVLRRRFTTFRQANRAAERLNQRYGAVRYGVRLEQEAK